MISVTECAEEFNVIPTANVDNLAKTEWAGAESHYYSPSIAKEFGRDAAIVLRGLAWKIKHSRNDWRGDKGYYETLENLVKLRFPYLSPSGLWNVTTYLADDAKVLRRGTNNKRRYDRTTWYGLSDEMIRRALDDDGAIGFDVKVAISHEMPEALAIHHVRYYVRELVKSGQSYHKVNKAHLARTWNVDVATVKRAFVELVNDGLLAKHGTKSKFYTIPQIGASVNENGAFENSASVNETSAFVKQNGASVNENGAFVNDYTHSEAIRRPFRNHSNPGGRTPLNGEPCQSSHSSPATDKQVHKTDTNKRLNTFAELRRQNELLAPVVARLTEDIGQVAYDHTLFDMADGFLFESSTEDIDQHLSKPSLENALKDLQGGLASFVGKHIDQLANWPIASNAELYGAIYYPALEITLCSFQIDAITARKFGCTIKDHWSVVDQVHEQMMERRASDADSSVHRKVQVFKEAVELRNRHGWELASGSSLRDAVCIKAAYLKGIDHIFTLNPHLTPAALVSVLHECVGWSQEPVPAKGDRHYYTRQGDDLGKFTRTLDSIVKELHMSEECPVAQL